MTYTVQFNMVNGLDLYGAFAVFLKTQSTTLYTKSHAQQKQFGFGSRLGAPSDYWMTVLWTVAPKPQRPNSNHRLITVAVLNQILRTEVACLTFLVFNKS